MLVVKEWKDLIGVKNDKYWIDVDLEWGRGWIREIGRNTTVSYLSTHTFYGLKCTGNAEYILQKYGFDIKIDVTTKEDQGDR